MTRRKTRNLKRDWRGKRISNPTVISFYSHQSCSHYHINVRRCFIGESDNLPTTTESPYVSVMSACTCTKALGVTNTTWGSIYVVCNIFHDIQGP